MVVASEHGTQLNRSGMLSAIMPQMPSVRWERHHTIVEYTLRTCALSCEHSATLLHAFHAL